MAGGGLGFGSGFAQGLAGAFSDARKQNIDRENRKADMAMKAFIALKDDPSVRDYNDLAPFLEAGMGGESGGFFGKRKKGSPDIHAILAQVLGPHLGTRGASGGTGTSIARGTSTGSPAMNLAGGDVDQTPPSPVPLQKPSAVGTGVTPPSFLTSPIEKQAPGVGSDVILPMFGGGGDQAATAPSIDPTQPSAQKLFAQPSVADQAAAGSPARTGASATVTGNAPARTGLFLSHDEQAARTVADNSAALEGKITTQISLARRILPELQALDPTMTMDDALRAVGISEPRDYLGGSGGASQSIGGEIPDGKGGYTPAYAIFDRQRQAYINPETHEIMTGFRPKFTTAAGTVNQSLGADREALSRELFGKRANQLTQDQMAQVNAELPAYQQRISRGRALGTGQGNFEAPIDVKDAQASGAAVGSSSADYTGQVVPKADDTQRRRSVEAVKEQIKHIRTLLSVLPGDHELGGMAPGAVYSLRKRDPKYRAQIASLESAVNGIVNVLARAVGEQRGTQTEADAERAYSQAVATRDAFLSGDTRESATARLDESDQIIDLITGQLPPAIAPTQAPGGARTVTAAGARRPAGSPAPPVNEGGRSNPTNGAQSTDGKFRVEYADPRTGQRKIKVFPTQAAADLFKRALPAVQP